MERRRNRATGETEREITATHRRRALRRRIRRQLGEFYRALGTVAAFVAFAALLGVAQSPEALGGAPGGATSLGSAGESSPTRLLPPTPREMSWPSTAPALWLVDGFNVLNVAVLHGDERRDFWGPRARARLLDLVCTRADAERIVVVFDGSRPEGEAPDGAASVIFADDADAWLLARLREEPEASAVAVVTADRRLAARARHRGAQIVEPAAFVGACYRAQRGADAVAAAEDSATPTLARRDTAS